jgi:hypothetical protein
MSLQVDVPPAIADRLNSVSAKRRWFPFDEHVIDWSVPLGDEWCYMPRQHSAIAEADWYRSAPVEAHPFLERFEVTQYMRNIAHGEHLLNQGILAMLWQVDPYDPNFRYLLHEVAEECQHMAMFNEWVRHNADITTVGEGEEEWGAEIGAFITGLAVRLPEAFWVNVLLFEFVGDEFNQALKGGTAPSLDGRPMHPTLVGIGVAHTAEEARHINYARHWLQRGMPGVDGDELLELQQLAESQVQTLIDRRSFLPLHWTEQLAPYVDADGFRSALFGRQGASLMVRQLKQLLDEFEALRVVRPETMRQWEEAGAFD